MYFPGSGTADSTPRKEPAQDNNATGPVLGPVCELMANS
jgi:hypothetical protein